MSRYISTALSGFEKVTDEDIGACESTWPREDMRNSMATNDRIAYANDYTTSRDEEHQGSQWHISAA